MTNLSRLSPLLNLIAVPDGDFERAIGHVYLSINLRRLGCSGRTAITLRFPRFLTNFFLSFPNLANRYLDDGDDDDDGMVLMARKKESHLFVWPLY